MLNIGCHLSISKGYENMGLTALEIGANTFQFFTRNPRGGGAKALDMEDVKKLNDIYEDKNFATLLAHAPYTINPASKTDKTRDFALMAMSEDIERLDLLPNNYYNFHPGSHVGQGTEKGIKLIVEILNQVMKEDMKTTMLLETMAGKGTEIGRSFEELRAIIDGVEIKSKIGVCLDTCHVYDAGYDIVNNLDGVLEEFDKIVGIDRLKAIHLNDSKNPFKSHKDRHEKIGEGSIGLKAFERIINHPQLKHLPFYLETPNELDGYKREIELLRGLND
ncbi:MAG: deoxyribonuclease IV [Tissierellia bacterium]|nr:deoxyribonuclease IV [Tissierellia bacterium]